MKAVRIRETRGLNPAFSPRGYYRALKEGREYEFNLEVTYSEGSIAEGPEVVVQCLLPEPTMIPADEECHAAVSKRLNAMKDRLAKLKKMAAPEVLKTLPPGLQKYVRVLSEKWDGSRIEQIISGQSELELRKETGEEDE